MERMTGEVHVRDVDTILLCKKSFSKGNDIDKLYDAVYNNSTSTRDVNELHNAFYNAIGAMKICGKNALIIDEAKKGIEGWNTVPFIDLCEKRKKVDQMLAHPPEVKDGDQECVKCKQRKVIVVEMQTRSADEGFTYKVMCYNAECKYIQTLS